MDRPRKIKPVDWALIVYPTILMLAVLLFFLFVTESRSKTFFKDREVLFAAAVISFGILGNFAHNFLSFWQILRIDEFKEWSKEFRFLKLNIWQLTTLTFIFFFILIKFGLGYEYDTFLNPIKHNFFSRLIVFLFLTLNLFHSNSQNQGISFRMSYNYLNPKQAQAISRLERIFYRYILVDWIIFVGPIFLFGYEKVKNYIFLRNSLLAFAFILLFYSYRHLSLRDFLIKVLYTMRLSYRFFISWNPIFAYVSFIFHGLDANLIYWNSCKQNTFKRNKLIIYEFLSVYTALGIIHYFVYFHNGGFKFIGGYIFPSIFLTHYVIEGFMYRMRNQTTKKYIGPLLSR